MNRSISIAITASLALAAAGLTGCGTKETTETNMIEMNATDGSMNDMTVVESSTLDAAGASLGNEVLETGDAGNASNAM